MNVGSCCREPVIRLAHTPRRGHRDARTCRRKTTAGLYSKGWEEFAGPARRRWTSYLPRKLAGEALGTALLLAVVIGSGIMGERLSGGNVAIALLANALATVGGPCILMAILQWSTRVRTGTGQWIAEAVATAGLLLVILRAPAGRAAAMVAIYIGAACWFTASTSFANPAAAFGRMFSDSFAGIAPGSVPGFVLAQFAGAATGLAIHRTLEPRLHPKGHPNVIEASGVEQEVQ